MGLKIFRLFVIGFSLLIILTTSKNPLDLFRGATVFLLGLSYDYGSILSITKRYSFHQVFSVMGLFLVLTYLMFSLLGAFNIILPSETNPQLLIFCQDSQIFNFFSLDKDWFTYSMFIFWIMELFLLSNPINKQQSVTI